MLNGGQLASSSESRGEYSAYTLVSRDDIFHFAEDLNLHPDKRCKRRVCESEYVLRPAQRDPKGIDREGSA